MKVSNDNNQYADHVGIELLCLSVLCERDAAGEDDMTPLRQRFASDRMLGWIGSFSNRVSDEAPDGYYARIAKLTEALLLIAAL